MEKKSIIWNNQNYTIDFETNTIYKENTINYGDNLLPIGARIGNYHFREFRGGLYFTDDKNYYKIEGNNVIEINRDEYLEAKSYITINKKSPATYSLIEKYVLSIFIDSVLNEKFNLNVSTPVDSVSFLSGFSKNFNTRIKGETKNIAMQVITNLPLYFKRKEIKQQVKKICSNIFKENDEYFQNLIDMIYLSNKERFDYLADDIINSREKRKNNINSGDNFSKYTEIDCMPEDPIEQKGKSK